jgi:hypothetical protein
MGSVENVLFLSGNFLKKHFSIPIYNIQKSVTHLGVTVPFKNNCKNSCMMAINQAVCGATSQMKPRNFDLPQKRNITAKLIFNRKHTHVTPVNSQKREN